MNRPDKTVAEFFAGIGLMRIGLENAGWRTVFANDIDEDKWQMYRDHFGDTGEFILGDIHKLESSQIPDVALATASFPCNDLSLAGARHGLAGAQSSAFWGFIDVLKAMKRERRLPPLVLLENVIGFLTSREGRDFEDALLALNDLGYAVDAFIVDAARFVPQSRKRLFVVGVKTPNMSRRSEATQFYQTGVEPSPSPRPSGDHVSRSEHPVSGDKIVAGLGSHWVGERGTTMEKPLTQSLRPAALASFMITHPDIHWRVRELPPLPTRTKTLADILESLPLNHQMWWNRTRCKYLLSQMSAKHRAEADAMIRGKTVRYGAVFRRVRKGKSMAELRVDGIAGCLRTPRGGSGRQILFMAGRGHFAVRLLTGRECARLMGADDFKLEAPLNQALFGFGDAVCVPVIEWIAENYLDPVRLFETEGAVGL